MTEETATTVETGEGAATVTSQTSEETKQTPFVVGANSVYPDVASLFEGAKQKEAFIETLKAEKRQLEEQLKALTNINKFQEDIKKMEDNNTVTQVTQPTSEITEAKVKELAQAALLEQQTKMLQENNLKEVNSTLQKVFGAEADNKLDAKCKELGISKEIAMGLAKDSPKALLKMLGLDAPAMVSVDDILAKGRIADTTTAPQAPKTGVEALIANPALAKDRTYLQGLFKEGMKDPSKILMADTEWAPIGG